VLFLVNQTRIRVARVVILVEIIKALEEAMIEASNMFEAP
jgi:hypothetical protein